MQAKHQTEIDMLNQILADPELSKSLINVALAILSLLGAVATWAAANIATKAKSEGAVAKNQVIQIAQDEFLKIVEIAIGYARNRITGGADAQGASPMGTVIVPGSPAAAMLAQPINENHPVVKEAVAYVKASKPDLVASQKLTDEKIAKAVIARYPQAIA